MSVGKFVKDETARVKALAEYAAIGTEFRNSFDDIARLACQVCDTPIAMVGFLDDTRLWYQGLVGVNLAALGLPGASFSIPRDLTFCTHTILEADGCSVRDALEDPRFSSHPLVVAKPYLRFYVGVPLTTIDGFPIGSLCVADTRPRELTDGQRLALRLLADHVMKLLVLRRSNTRSVGAGTGAGAAAAADASAAPAAGSDATATALPAEDVDLRQYSDRMSEYGRVAADATHELNNMLASVISRLELLQGVSLGEEAAEHVRRALVSTARLEKILGSLKMFARDGKREPMGPVLLGDIVESLQELVAARIARERFTLEIADSFRSTRVRGRQSQIIQILTNLVLNSVDALAGAPERWARLEVVPAAAGDSAAASADGVVVRIVDAGSGIPENVRTRMMNPFFTTKAPGKGTGLGLSISKDLAESMNARLELDTSQPHTTFHLVFPKAA